MSQDPVMAMVEKELRATPDISSAELHQKVTKKHAQVGELTTRQFHARYPLRVKKKWSLEHGTTKKRDSSKGNRRRAPRQKKTPGADSTRDLLVKFAGELLQQPNASFTTVMDKVDKYAVLLDEK